MIEVGPQFNNGESFSDCVFSVVFGDGDPNSLMLRNQWKALAAVIDSNNRAVVAEQVRPYLFNQWRFEGTEIDVLPVLAYFNGYPKVSKDGDIVYVFDEFESTADLSNQKQDLTDAYLGKNLHQFSRLNSSIASSVWMMAVFN